MSNEFEKLLKTKTLSPKSAVCNKPSRIGITNTQLAAPKPGQAKHKGRRSIILMPKTLNPPVQYHPWKLEYSQIFIREKTRKSMTKDSYTPAIRSFAHANQSITTEEECNPVLIPAHTIHIEKPIIHQRKKPLLPSIVRYLRGNELFPSERYMLQTHNKPHSLSRLQVKTKPPFFNVNNTAPNLATTDRLLNRAPMRDDASVIRRPPRRLLINIKKPILPLSIYG